jgi:fructan beta-fructosidase
MTRAIVSSKANRTSLRLLCFLIAVNTLILTIACTCAAQTQAPSEREASAEQQPNANLYRPAFHFSPNRNWINDPAGLVYDGTEYHLFNQYNPFGDQWGHMSWSHAVSKDLISWRELPVTLSEENDVAIFTGSAVVDSANTSGFGRNGAAPLVAVYTGNSKGLQTQNIAYSTDHGLTWTKYSGNPVVDLHESDFRDPMVFWHEQTKRWIMVVSLALKHKVLLFSSEDLKNWAELSEFGSAGANGAPNWECPNLFELPVSNVPGVKKWVLMVGIGDNGPAGGSATQYFVGEFDGKKFVNDNASNQTLWVDYGSDFYAGQTWSNLVEADGSRIAIAWMDNWKYADKLPTSPWRGQTTSPRALTLMKTSEGIRLTQSPAKELSALRDQHFHARNATWQQLEALLSKREWTETLELEAVLDVNGAQEFGFSFRTGPHYGTRVGFDPTWSTVYIDRRHSGDLIVGPTFNARHDAPIRLENGRIKMHILLDRSSVELFADNGVLTITDLIYPREQDRGLGVYAAGRPPSVKSLDIWTLKQAADPK